MKRREFFKTMSLSALTLSGINSIPVMAKAAKKRSKPNKDKGKKFLNIVILYADDLGYGDLGSYNKESKIPTPNLDKFAAQSVRFTDGHSSSAICSPSRYALLTGRYHWRKFTTIAGAFASSKFDGAELTLPEMLREKGYTTACIGKWHLGFDWRAVLNPGQDFPVKKKGVVMSASAFDWSKKVPDGPTAHGFDYYFGDGTPNFPPYGWMENDKMLVAPTVSSVPAVENSPQTSFSIRPGPAVKDWKLDKVMPTLTEKAVEWIGKQKNSAKPFFLYFPWTSPHAPVVPVNEFVGKSKVDYYGDYVVQSDDTAGRVLRALRDNGFEDNTIVIFSSDNGPAGSMMARYTKTAHNSSGLLNGMKIDIYEGGHRVPFIIKWPGVTRAGRVSDALISQIDIMRTIANFIDYTLPAGQAEDSIDLMPVLNESSSTVRDTLVLNTKKGKYGIRHKDWVYLQDTASRINKLPRSKTVKEYLDKSGLVPETQKQALYHIGKDYRQCRNVKDQHPEVVVQLTELLNKIKKE